MRNNKSHFGFSLPLFLISLFIFSFGHAFAAEKISNFETTIVVNKDGTADVTEVISYDFGAAQRHGIFRNIITTKTNEDGDRFKLTLSEIKVADPSGRPVKFKIEKTSGEISIKIGDANVLISGLQIYKISYKVSGALTYYTDHDELYWNVTGNGWEVPIQQTLTNIYLPVEVIGKTGVEVVCYTGVSGSTEQNCLTDLLNNRITLEGLSVLNPGEGITAVVGFPTGIVTRLEPVKDEPSLFQKIVSTIFGLGMLVLGAIWFVFYPAKILINYLKEQSNLKSKQRIVAAWFESPETLSKRTLVPAETGALVDKNIDHKDISATIIDLAQRGYIKIRVEEKNNVWIDKVKEYASDTSLLDFEIEILNGLFSSGSKDSVKIKDLSDSVKFYTSTEKFKKLVSQRLVDEKLFKDNPLNTEVKFAVISGVAFTTFNIILGIIALVFGRKSARRTDLGIEKYSEGASLKNFLVSQDAQINFQSQNQMFFEKLLPYATAFGVEKIWAKRFEGLQMVKPDWYDGDISNMMVLSSLSNSLNSGIRSNAASMSSTRSSSGFHSGFSGGHSGGGGGGGGGGSW